MTDLTDVSLVCKNASLVYMFTFTTDPGEPFFRNRLEGEPAGLNGAYE